jgi:heme exporter protein B
MIWALLKKEWLLLGRSFHGVVSMLVLSLTILFLFHFSMERVSPLNKESLIGMKWTIVFLVSFVLIGQSVWEERESGAGLVIQKWVSPWLFYLGKCFAVWILLILLEVLILGFQSLFFQNASFKSIPADLAYLISGSLSLTFLGISFGGFANSSRMKEIVLPLLLVPFSIPIFLYGLNAEFRYSETGNFENSSFLLMIFFCIFYGALGALFQEIQSEDIHGS